MLSRHHDGSCTLPKIIEMRILPELAKRGLTSSRGRGPGQSIELLLFLSRGAAVNASRCHLLITR